PAWLGRLTASLGWRGLEAPLVLRPRGAAGRPDRRGGEPSRAPASWGGVPPSPTQADPHLAGADLPSGAVGGPLLPAPRLQGGGAPLRATPYALERLLSRPVTSRAGADPRLGRFGHLHAPGGGRGKPCSSCCSFQIRNASVRIWDATPLARLPRRYRTSW